MKKSIFLTSIMLIAVLFTNCSIDKDPNNGKDGVDGVNTYIDWVRLPVGSTECLSGGIKLTKGTDNSLETETEVICNGEDGKSLAAHFELVAGTSEYPNGGYDFTIGLDVDGDGELSSLEILQGQTFFIPFGNDGSNGYTTLQRSTEIEGGTLIELFLDFNRDNTITNEDILSNSYIVFNGEKGERGLQGLQGIQGIQGETGVQGVEGTAGQDGQDAYQLRSTSITTTEGTEVTFYLDVDGDKLFTQGDNIVDVFLIKNGLTPIVTYSPIDPNNEYLYGATEIIITVGDKVTTFIVTNGEKGVDGERGDNGVCPECDLKEDCEDGKVTICHEGTLKEYTFSEYVFHIFTEHGGDATKDTYGTCFTPIRIAVKDPNNKFEGQGANCHWNWTEITLNSQEELDQARNGVYNNLSIPYPNNTFRLADGEKADDYDCVAYADNNKPNL